MRTNLWAGVVAALLAFEGGAAAEDTVANGPLRPLMAAPDVVLDSAGPYRAGVGLQFMPVGWFELYDPAGRDFRAYPALGVAAFVDYRLNRYASLGLSPALTLNVIPNRGMDSGGSMVTLKAPLKVLYPTRTFEPYAVVAPGYSVIRRHDVGDASGPTVEVALGLGYRVRLRHAIFVEIGYQRGFHQARGQPFSPSYVITSIGWQIAF